MKIVCEFENFEEMMEFAAKMQRKGEKCTRTSHQDVQGTNSIPADTSVPQTVAQDSRMDAADSAPAQQTMVQQVQTSAPSYSLDDLCSAAMTLMDKGMQMQLQQLLIGYGVTSLPELPKEQYGAFATALRGMGAQI